MMTMVTFETDTRAAVVRHVGRDGVAWMTACYLQDRERPEFGTVEVKVVEAMTLAEAEQVAHEWVGDRV